MNKTIDYFKSNIPMTVTILVLILAVLSVVLMIVFTQGTPKPTGKELNGLWSEGQKDNPKVIVEIFEDFGCPHCKDFTLKEEPVLVAKLAGKSVRFDFKHFILGSFANSREAAMASETAGAQGKFFEYRKELFNNQGKYSMDDFKKYAGNVGLDVSKFEADMKDKKYLNDVLVDGERVKELKLSGTPSIVINGKPLQIKSSYVSETYDAVLDELEK